MEADLPGTGWVSTHPVKRGEEPTQFGGSSTDEADEPSIDEPSTGKATTGATGGATRTSATGTGGDALGPEAVRTGRPKLQGGEEAVPGYGETPQFHQPVPGRGAR